MKITPDLGERMGAVKEAQALSRKGRQDDSPCIMAKGIPDVKKRIRLAKEAQALSRSGAITAADTRDDGG